MTTEVLVVHRVADYAEDSSFRYLVFREEAAFSEG